MDGNPKPKPRKTPPPSPYHVPVALNRYTISWRPLEQMEDCHGLTLPEEKEIWLSKKIRRSKRLHMEVKIHEYLHAVRFAYGLTVNDRDHEESIVSTTAVGLAAILLARGVNPHDI